jgi:hypothetical protein
MIYDADIQFLERYVASFIDACVDDYFGVFWSNFQYFGGNASSFEVLCISKVILTIKRGLRCKVIYLYLLVCFHWFCVCFGVKN